MTTYIVTVDVPRNLEPVRKAVEHYGRTEAYSAIKRAFKLFSDENESEVMLTLSNLEHVSGVAFGDDEVAPVAFQTDLLPVGRLYTEKLNALRVKSSQDPKERTLNPWWTEPGLFPWRYDDQRLGKGAIIAIVDGGIRWGHPEFQKNPDRVTRIFNWSTVQEGASNHGTACAAFAAGDISGVAPLADLLDVKVFPDDGGNTQNSYIVDGMNALLAWAQDPLNNPEDKTIIANMSFGSASFNNNNPYGSLIQDLHEAGVISIIAAGNDSENLDTNFNAWPAESSDYAIGSIHYDGRRSHFSNYGSRVKFYGFGHRLWGAGYPGGHGYQDISGTSFAAPYVCGCLATFAPGRWKPSSFQEVRSFMAEFESHCAEGIYGRYVKTDKAQPIEGLILGRADYNPVLPGRVDVLQVNTIAKFGSPEKGVLAWKERVTPIFGGVPVGVGAENVQFAVFVEGPFFASDGSDGPWLDSAYVPTGWSIANDRAGNNSGASGAGMFVVNDATLIVKEYWEIEVKSAPTGMSFGVTKETNLVNYDEATTGIGAAGIEWFADGSLTVDGVAQAAISPFADGDVLMFAYDADTGDLWLGKNGTWEDNPTADPATASTSAGDSRAAITLEQDGSQVQLLGDEAHQNYSVADFTGFAVGAEKEWKLDTIYQGSGHSITENDTRLTNVSGGSNYVSWVPTTDRIQDTVTDMIYFEVDFLAGPSSTNGYISLVTEDTIAAGPTSGGFPADQGGTGIRGDGNIWASEGATGSAYSKVSGLLSFGNGNTLMVCFNPSTNELWTGTDGVWNDDPETDPPTYTVYDTSQWAVALMTRDTDTSCKLISLSTDLTYPIPTGAVALGSIT